MANKGLCVAFRAQGKTYYQACPFMPGIFRVSVHGGRATDREKKIAGLLHAYKTALQCGQGGAADFFP